MFTATLPGEMKAKIACIMLDIALIGPQFVSPNTRKPTNINGNESSTAMNDNQMGMPMLKYWTKHTTTVIKTEPMTTQRMGKFRSSTLLPFKPWNVLTIRCHFKANEVSPPATIKPVAGHITQRRVAGNVASVIRPWARRYPGRMNQLIIIPSPIARQMRKPTSSPEPNDNKLQLRPIFICCIPGRSQVSGNDLRKLVRYISKAEA